MKTTVTHFAATFIFIIVYVVLYVNKNTRYESYEASLVRHLEAVKSGTGVLEFDEYMLTYYKPKQDESYLFTDINKKDANLTIIKIDSLLSKKIFSKITEHKPFAATARVEGKDFTATFLPLGDAMGSGYAVSYRQDGYLAKLERDFNEAVFFLIAAALVVKVAAMWITARLFEKNRRCGIG